VVGTAAYFNNLNLLKSIKCLDSSWELNDCILAIIFDTKLSKLVITPSIHLSVLLSQLFLIRAYILSRNSYGKILSTRDSLCSVSFELFNETWRPSSKLIWQFNSELSMIIVTHHIEMSMRSDNCRVTFTTGNHVYQDVEAAWSRYFYHRRLFFTRLLLRINAKLAKGVTSPHVDFCKFKWGAFLTLLSISCDFWQTLIFMLRFLDNFTCRVV
jgi:hypothetical protein